MQIVLHLKDKFGKALALVVVNVIQFVDGLHQPDTECIDNGLGFNHWFGVYGNAVANDVVMDGSCRLAIGYQRK